MRVLVLLLAIFAFPAYAQEALPIQNACEVRANYAADESNDAEYQPGVDVNGNMVAPADLNQSLNINVEAIEIPIQFEVLDAFPSIDVPDGIDLDFDVANIRIHQDGRVEFNGQDLTQEFITLCSKANASVERAPSPEELKKIDVETLEEPNAAAGQAANDAINSSADEGIQGEYLPPEEN